MPEHDSSHLAALLDVARSERMSPDEALAERAYSERLQANLIRYLRGR